MVGEYEPMMTDPFVDEKWVRGMEQRSSRCAEQTRRRAGRNRLLQEREWFLELGADPPWVATVLAEREGHENTSTKAAGDMPVARRGC